MKHFTIFTPFTRHQPASVLAGLFGGRFIVAAVAMLFFIAMTTTAWGQLLTENFSYSTGDLTIGSGAGQDRSGGNWVPFSGAGSNIMQVVSGSLSFTNYGSSGVDNKVTLINGSAEDAYRAFTTQTSGTVYAGFLVNVTTTTGLTANSSTTGDYFAGFLPSTSTTALDSRVSIRTGSVAGTYNFGLRATSSNSTTSFSTTDYTTGTAHLIVISYQFVSGTTNDVMSMWIDPPFCGGQPVATLSQTGAATDLANVTRFFLRQGTSAVNAEIDGIRVGTSWSDVITQLTVTPPTATTGVATNITTTTVTLNGSVSSNNATTSVTFD